MYLSPHVTLPDAPVPVVHLNAFVGDKGIHRPVIEEAIVVVFTFWSGSCDVWFHGSNLLISGIYRYTASREDFGSLSVFSIYEFWIGFILIIVLWDNAHGVFLPLMVCKEPQCDGLEAQ
jgi:hypothetical protein